MYDAVGNRTYENNNGTETYFTYDAANEMTQAYNATEDSTTSYSYDVMGNCLSIAEADGTTYFTYNDANLVTSITYPDSTVNYFYYDGLMRRYAMEDSAGLTYFVWDKGGLNLLAEKDASGNVTAEYIHGYSPVTGIGSLVAAKKTVGETTYYQYPQYDHRGSVVGLTDKTGAVIASYEYNAFGEVISADESTEVQAAGNRFRYQSNWMTLGDSGDRFYISAARVYDAKLGRFLQRDPLFSGQFLAHRFAFINKPFSALINRLKELVSYHQYNMNDLLCNSYSYCGSNIKFVDQYGLFSSMERMSDLGDGGWDVDQKFKDIDTHSTPSCKSTDCCPDALAKLTKWSSATAKRFIELALDIKNLKNVDPRGYNGHIMQIEQSVKNVMRCVKVVIDVCNKQIPPPSFPKVPDYVVEPKTVPIPDFPFNLDPALTMEEKIMFAIGAGMLLYGASKMSGGGTPYKMVPME